MLRTTDIRRVLILVLFLFCFKENKERRKISLAFARSTESVGEAEQMCGRW